MAADEELNGLWRQLTAQRADLVRRLQDELQRTLFDSRAFLRPSDLKHLASAEADAFLLFLSEREPETVEKHGRHLCAVGVGDQTILLIGGALRAFLEAHLGVTDAANVRRLGEDYHRHLLQGFIRARETIILEEQERIRSALQNALHRYTLQIETAASVARATISTLDLGELLINTVDLIRERFGLDYVGIYFVSTDRTDLVLRAASGMAGRRRLAAEHSLRIEGSSTVGRCVVNRRHIMSGISGSQQFPETDSSWLSQTQSELALPLISRDVVIGALTVQSYRPAAFSSQDIPGFQIMADQLANAIENARLFADARRRADELALAYAQLKELDQLKDQFMQNVSHELRTPLTIIGGYAELLATGELGPLDQRQQESVDVILRYGNDLRDLVEDILAILEVRGRRPALANLSMVELVETSMADFNQMATEKEVTLTMDLQDPASIPPVLAKPEHMRRILDNLLGNALKFTGAGDHVTVRLWNGDGRVFLAVEDTGIGLEADQLDRVFDRFFQVDGSLRRRYGGAGLGLSLVKELVESYGGQVTAASPGLDQGATFTISLPGTAYPLDAVPLLNL